MLPTERFSGRATNYAQYRPTYPPAMLLFLKQQFGLSPQSRIADIGSGTGILSALLIREGYEVFAVEPNAEMRKKAELELSGNKKFTSMDGSGEHTRLPDHSVDLITVAQAFHWIDHTKAKAEFQRILAPGGRIAIMWNLHSQETAFGKDYEALKRRFGADYITIRKSHEPDLTDFFAPEKMLIQVFTHHMYLNRDGFRGQIQSSSFLPLEGQPNFAEMMNTVDEIFNTYQENGVVTMEYITKLYYS